MPIVSAMLPAPYYMQIVYGGFLAHPLWLPCATHLCVGQETMVQATAAAPGLFAASS